VVLPAAFFPGPPGRCHAVIAAIESTAVATPVHIHGGLSRNRGVSTAGFSLGPSGIETIKAFLMLPRNSATDSNRSSFFPAVALLMNSFTSVKKRLAISCRG
jgi:hypothetical protein